jgi:hypothetical protein
VHEGVKARVQKLDRRIDVKVKQTFALTFAMLIQANCFGKPIANPRSLSEAWMWPRFSKNATTRQLSRQLRRDEVAAFFVNRLKRSASMDACSRAHPLLGKLEGYDGASPI